jgi:rare lipoprotein A
VNYIALFLALFLFQGCVITNPFTPPTSGTIYQEASSYPSEPIKTKAMYRATMRPYTVAGVRYTPIIPEIGQVFHGTASWYGPNFHGNKTSNGEYYDMHANTAAHKTLPINTLVQVTNLKTGESTIVRINDRGPFVNNRIIDLSYQAALEAGIVKHGTAKVKLEVLDFDERARAYASHRAKKPKKEIITPIQEPEEYISNPLLYQVQIASTDNKRQANKLAKEFAIIDGKYKSRIKTKTFWQKTHYKVLIGDFKTVDEAQDFIASHYFDGAFVVKD